MATNDRVIYRSADDRTLNDRSAECLLEAPTDGGYLYSDPTSTYYIFTTYDSGSGTTLMIQKRLEKLTEI